MILPLDRSTTRRDKLIARGQGEIAFDSRIAATSFGHDLKTSNSIAVRVHLFAVDHARDHVDLAYAELSALRHERTIHAHARASVVVETVAVAAAVIGVQVDAAALGRGAADQVDSTVGFAQLMVTTARVGDYLHAVQCQIYMRTLRKFSNMLFSFLFIFVDN